MGDPSNNSIRVNLVLIVANAVRGALEGDEVATAKAFNFWYLVKGRVSLNEFSVFRLLQEYAT